MAKFECSVNMDNAAFEGYPPAELARILREMIKNIEYDDDGGILKDINGNTVGEWFIDED